MKFIGVSINLPFDSSVVADPGLCSQFEVPDITCCRQAFLVNLGLSSDSEAVNYSVNLYFIRGEINYMKLCHLDFNGYWPMAVFMD